MGRSWVSNRIPVALESWHTVRFFFLQHLKAPKWVSPSIIQQRFPSPKNWANEKPKCLIGLNTVFCRCYPPHPYHLFCFHFPCLHPVFSFSLSLFFILIFEFQRWKKSMAVVLFSFGSSPLNLSTSRELSESAPEICWGWNFHLTSLILWLRQLMSLSATGTWTGKLSWPICISEFSFNPSLSLITSLCNVCLKETS